MHSISPSLNTHNKTNNSYYQNQQDFIQTILNAGVENIPSIEINPNKFQRFGKDKKYSLLYIGDYGYFKDWTGQIDDIHWFADTTKNDLTFEARQELKRKIAIEKKEREEELNNQYEQASIKANQIWSSLFPSGTSLYLKNKSLNAIAGIRFGNDSKGNFIATALSDNFNKIWSLQFIYDNKFKKFLSDAKTKGCYSQFGNQESSSVFICEGLATGLSILSANQDYLVVIAYNCGNLKEVTANIKIKYPQKKIIIAGDNDLSKPNNVGKLKAEEAAKELGLNCVFPSFKDLSTNPTDFDDLRQLEGIEEVKNQLGNSIINNIISEWEEPILFVDEYQPPEIPTDILPSQLSEFAKAISKSTETPESMAVITIISVLSTALQGKVEVKSFINQDYKETVNLYILTALPPANRKSSILSYCTRPLLNWEREQKEILEPEIKKQKSRYESERKIIDGLRNKLKSDNFDQKLLDEIDEREMALKEPDKLPRLFVNDTTPESLAIMVDEQKGRMSIFSDEGGIIDTMAGLYSGGNSNVDILLKGWDGGNVRQKRKDREVDVNPLLTINLIVQPIIIQNLGNKKAYNGKGLLERFLYCLPSSKLGYRNHNQPSPTQDIINQYNNKIRNLLSIPYPKEPTIFSLDDLAFKEWREFQDMIEIELRPEGSLTTCQGWGGKICGHALRIAALLHIAEFGIGKTLINRETINKSLNICSILTHHAVAAFGLMEINQDVKDSKAIFQWICDTNLLSFTKAELTKKMQNRVLMKAKRLDELLSILTQRNIISEPNKEGKKTIRFYVNPAISNKWGAK